MIKLWQKLSRSNRSFLSLYRLSYVVYSFFSCSFCSLFTHYVWSVFVEIYYYLINSFSFSSKKCFLFLFFLAKKNIHKEVDIMNRHYLQVQLDWPKNAPSELVVRWPLKDTRPSIKETIWNHDKEIRADDPVHVLGDIRLRTLAESRPLLWSMASAVASVLLWQFSPSTWSLLLRCDTYLTIQSCWW